MLSVVTSVLNGVRFVKNLMKSVASLHIPYERIIIDRGSTDEALEIIRKNEGRFVSWILNWIVPSD